MQNEIFMTLLASLVALLVCITAGYIGRKKGIITDTLNTGMSDILLKISLPCLIFVSMMRPFSPTLLLESIATFFISGTVFLFGCLLGFLFTKAMNPKEGEGPVWQFSLTFPNAAFMGFPIIHALYGYEGMIFATMLSAAFNVLVFSLGVYLFERGKKVDWKAVTLTPTFIATYLGILFFVTGLRLPIQVQDGIGVIGNMSLPLSMMLVGSILAKEKLEEMFNDVKVVPIILTRLLVIPIIAFFILRTFVHNIVMLEVVVILVAMPAATMAAIFADQYNGNTTTASKIVALSSILSVVSIPAVTVLISLFRIY